MALHNYHAQFGHFPPGAIEVRPQVPDGRQFAWSAFLLPQLEQAQVVSRIDFSYPYDAPENAEIASSVIPTFLCPSTPRDSQPIDGFGATDYGGVYGERIETNNTPPRGMMIHDEALRFRDIFDGSSYTLMLAEDAAFPDGQWINGRNLFDQAFAPNAAPAFENDMRSFHPGLVMTLRSDGAAQVVVDQIDLKILAALCTRNGGEVIDATDL
ncbi:MAG: DUF1559 domain-containing protein [Planctomycetota bacterium]